MGIDNNDDVERIDQVNTCGFVNNIRFRMIKRLAGSNVVVLNAIIASPMGLAIATKEFGNSGLISNNLFHMGMYYQPVPGTVMMSGGIFNAD